MKKKYLKITACIIISVLSALTFTYSVFLQDMQESFDKELYSNVIRLHILAQSDSASDQSAKLKVRDGVSGYIYSLVEDTKNSNEAERIIAENLDGIRETVKKTVKELGYSYSTDVTFNKEYYPVRYYEGFSFPSGYYRSLKITLGSGKGKNWWCVLYPTVCGSMSTDTKEKLTDSGISEKTADMLCSEDKKYEYGFYILELLNFKK